jgi:hypothetical protein
VCVCVCVCDRVELGAARCENKPAPKARVPFKLATAVWEFCLLLLW